MPWQVVGLFLGSDYQVVLVFHAEKCLIANLGIQLPTEKFEKVCFASAVRMHGGSIEKSFPNGVGWWCLDVSAEQENRTTEAWNFSRPKTAKQSTVRGSPPTWDEAFLRTTF